MKDKRVKWTVGLYPYNLSDKHELYPRVNLRGTVTLDELAVVLERRTGIHRKENVRAVLSLMASLTEEYLVEGFAVAGPLGTLTPGVTGMWNFDRLKPQARAENQAVVNFTASGRLKASLANPLFRVSQRRRTGLVIGKVCNRYAVAEERQEWFPGDLLVIEGGLLLMNGDDPARGLYFISTDGNNKDVQILPSDFLLNSRSQIMIRIPGVMPAGEYGLRVVSQCTTSPRPLQKPHTYQTGETFCIGKK